MKQSASFVANGFSILVVGLALTMTVRAADDIRREMWQEPSHQLVFEQEHLRILDVRVVPGVTSEYHSHHFATVYLMLQDALMQSQDEGQEWSARAERTLQPPGALVDRADYYFSNTYHRVKNCDDQTLHLLAVVNSAARANASVPQPAASIDHPWFVEHRLKLAPGASSNVLSFLNDTVVAQYRDGMAHVLEDGVIHGHRSTAGAWSLHESGSRFQLVNADTKPLEFVLIEVKP